MCIHTEFLLTELSGHCHIYVTSVDTDLYVHMGDHGV